MGECFDCGRETTYLEEHHSMCPDPETLELKKIIIYLCPPCGHLYG